MFKTAENIIAIFYVCKYDYIILERDREIERDINYNMPISNTDIGRDRQKDGDLYINIQKEKYR